MAVGIRDGHQLPPKTKRQKGNAAWPTLRGTKLAKSPNQGPGIRQQRKDMLRTA